MKLTIKTKDLELTYEDEYSKIEADARDRIKDLLKTIFEHRIVDHTTVEEFFNKTKANKI